MSTKTNYALQALTVVAWIIFLGVCIEAGVFIVNAFQIILIKPAALHKFWIEVNLSELYQYNDSHFITLTCLIIIVAVLRAIMFYNIVRLLHEKKLNLSQPFNETIRRFILNIAYLALGIGLFSFWGAAFTKNMVLQGVQMPTIEQLRIGGADVWLFMGVVLLVIAQMFKKGIEIQTENDLTV